jgi:AcrR family transcriptional regulator
METLNKRGRPRNEELLAQRREDILAYATDVFARHGFQRTDVQLIADGLGLGKGTIYRYFDSKEELFLACVDCGMAGLSIWINERVEPVEDPVLRFACAIRAFLAYFDARPDIVELLIQERAEFRDRQKPTFQAHREKNIGPWHELLSRLMDEGRVRCMSAEAITRVISNAMYGKLFTTYFNPERRTFLSQADELLTVVFVGILTDSEQQNLHNYLTESPL